MFAVFWNTPHALKINAMPCSWAQLNAIVLTQLSGISAYLSPQAPPLGQVFPILCLVEMPMLGLFPADTGPYNGANTKEFQRHHIKIRVFCKQRMLFGQISAWIMGSLLSFAEFQTFQLLYPVSYNSCLFKSCTLYFPSLIQILDFCLLSAFGLSEHPL